MPRTKHLVVTTVFTLFVMLMFGMVRVIGDVSPFAQRASVGSSIGVFGHENVSAPTVTVDSHEKDLSIRERLRAKLAHGVRASEPVVHEEEVIDVSTPDVPAQSTEGENGIIEGGRVVGNDLQSAHPQEGTLYACTTALERGVSLDTPWIQDGVWYPDKKPVVTNGASLTGAVSITSTGELRTIVSDGMPNHTAGIFSDSGVSPHTFSIVLPTVPTRNAVPYCIPRSIIGVAVNGVPIYAAQNAYGEDAVAYELLDACEGRPSENGLYHYYAESTCLFDQVYEGAPSTLLGYALDGFGIFASTESGGKIQNTDLDACHGHEHVIPWNGEMVSMYHYHMTDEFPYTVGCFMAEPKSLVGI